MQHHRASNGARGTMPALRLRRAAAVKQARGSAVKMTDQEWQQRCTAFCALL